MDVNINEEEKKDEEKMDENIDEEEKKDEKNIDVNIDEEEKNDEIQNEEKNNNDENEENNGDLIINEEKKENNLIDIENKEIKEPISKQKENIEKGIDLNQIAFKIMLLFNSQNKQLKEKGIYYLSNKNIINRINQKLKNTDINEIQFMQQSEQQQNINLSEDKYKFNNTNVLDLFLEKKEIIKNNNDKLELIKDFIFLNPEIYDLLLKLYNLEKNENIDNIFKKVELLKDDEKFIIMNICEENNIYVCEPEEKDEIKLFNIIFILIYSSKETYLIEYTSLEKNNFDVDLYLKEKKLNPNNYIQNIFDEKNNEVGYFINLKQPIEKEINEIKEEKNEIKKEKGNDFQNKPIGLLNLNRNSYLNSFLQCLYHIPQLTNFFTLDNNFSNLTEEFFIKEEYIKLNDLEIHTNSLSFKYLEVIYHLYHKKEKNGYYSPKNILEYIQNQDPKTFVKNEEISPKKLYSYFMAKLKEELKEKEQIKDLEHENDIFNSMIQNEEDKYKKYLSDFKFKNNSIIDQLFTGIKLSNIICEKCNESEQIFEDFYFLHFSLDKTEKNMENKFKKIDLNECFKYYFNNQQVSQICKKCGNNNTNVAKKINLSPKILTIFLGDIKEKGNLFKIEIEINIGEYLKEKNKRYKLICMITYFKTKGSNESYQAYCYSNEYNKWFCFVDEYVYEVDDIIKNIEESHRLPYIIFYKESAI